MMTFRLTGSAGAGGLASVLRGLALALVGLAWELGELAPS
jgi:hypothetical protein